MRCNSKISIIKFIIMKKYMTLLRKLFVKKSVCERCKGSGDLLLFCGIIEDCPRCDGSGNKKD